MSRRDPLQQTLDQLSLVAADPRSPESLTVLRKILAGRSSHAAAKAAQLAGESEIEMLVPDLVAAFRRFLDKPVKSDPGCAAKTAVAEALYRIGAPEIDLFLEGIRTVQLEPAWGEPVDTAVDLRGICALALIRVQYPDYLAEIAELLADRQPAARRSAAQALAYSENPAAIPLLRLKVLIGDEDTQVLSECLLAQLKIAGADAIQTVGRSLHHPSEEVSEAAALALGTSRLRAAFPVLREWVEGPLSSALLRSGLLAIATLKQDDAIDYLLGLVVQAAPLRAREAVRALAVFHHDDKLRAQAQARCNSAMTGCSTLSSRRSLAPADGRTGLPRPGAPGGSPGTPFGVALSVADSDVAARFGHVWRKEACWTKHPGGARCWNEGDGHEARAPRQPSGGLG